MKKAFKLIFIYLGVLLLAFIATIVFCAAFLFFYRDGNIFGIQYIKRNEIVYAQESDDMSSLEMIEIQGQNFPIRIRVHSSVTELKGAMQNKVFGYTTKAKARAKFTLDYNSQTKTAVFIASEPTGWLNKKNAYIEIAIPKDLAERGFDLKVKTSKGDITVGEDGGLNINDLYIVSTKGDVKIKSTSINDGITTDIGSGEIIIDGSCESAEKIGAKISVGSGKVDFSKINTEKFSFGTVEIVKNKRGRILILKAEELKTDGNINGGGRIEILEVGTVDFASLDTDIGVDKIIKKVQSRIRITGQGKVLVNNANCALTVEGHNGDITVKTATDTMDLKTNQGDIYVSNAVGYVSAVSEYGKINITFDKNAPDYNNTNQCRAVFASTKNGRIAVDGLQKGYITATGSGRISLNYDRVVGENVISAKSGVVNIVVPNPTANSVENEYAFNLRVATEINSDIKVGVAGAIGKVNTTNSGVFEYNNIYNSAPSTANNLKVSSTVGIIKIRSRDLANY